MSGMGDDFGQDSGAVPLDALATREDKVHVAMIRAGVHAARGLVMPRRVRVYVSGPCTGVPDANKPAFAAAEQALRAAGFDVVNPTTLPGHDAHDQRWLSFMRLDVAALMQCDAVATLPGWLGSAGALREVHIAGLFDFDVRELADWVAADARPHRPAALDGPASRRVGADAHCVRCDTLVGADSEGGEPA